MEEKPDPIPVNYLYFGWFFALLALMSASSVLVKEYFVGSRIFFLLYALGQAALEIGGFIFLAHLIRRWLGNLCFWFFIGATFALALFHILDFMMDRVLDLSVWNVVAFVLDASYSDFLFLLDASGIPFWAWVIFFILLACLPLLGIAIYKGTDLLVSKRPLLIRSELFLQMFVCVPVALFLWDCSASSIIHPDAYSALVRSLPWRFTFIEPQNVVIPLPGSLKHPPTEPEMESYLAQADFSLRKKPNVYLFIVESLREDFITPEAAPNLSTFRDQNIFYDPSVSNGNGTHLSWFSTFHSQFAIYWNQYKKNQWSLGSPALHLLKKMGYKIRVYSSAQLGYYGMEKLIFSPNHRLADSLTEFHHAGSVQPWQTDEKALEAMQRDLADPALQQGQLFIVFWDATHFDYSWPKHQPPPFAPFAKAISYFKAFQSKKNIEQIKNRYKNSVYFIDSLFGRFWSSLPRRDESVVIFMGDHGEEFFEQGHLFHNSHLSDEQTRIPLYFKFGAAPLPRPIVSQIDIFPSLIDYLSGAAFPFLDGESIFRPSSRNYTMIARFNGGRSPYEFCFHNGRHKLIAQLPNRRNIFATGPLKIRSLWNCQKSDFSDCHNSVTTWINTQFGPALTQTFIKQDQ